VTTHDYRETLSGIAGDPSAFIQSHPESFDIRLFKAKTLLPERYFIASPSISFCCGRPILRIAIATAEEIMGIEAPPNRAVEWEGEVVTQAVALRQIEDERSITLLIDVGEVLVGSVIEIVAHIRTGCIHWATYIITEICDDAPGGGRIYTCTPAQELCDGGFTFIEPPTNQGPSDKETEVYDLPTLYASPFVLHGQDVPHAFSHWQVWKSGETDNESVFDDCHVVGDLRCCPIRKGLLKPGQTYFWHVRYGGSGEEPTISDFSTATSFTMAESFEP
jgi:hypothetical protein